MAFSSFTSLTSDATLRELHTKRNGLSSDEAKERLAKNGLNEIHTEALRWTELLLRQLRSPFNYLLGGATLISFIMGEPLEGGLILLFIIVNTLLGFSQEYHSNKAVQLLKQFVVTNARVRRDGHEFTLPSRELVKGDVILLEAGNIVPADARVLEAQALTVDESILTGESIQVSKTNEPRPHTTDQTFEANNILFSGTTIVSGRATGVVVSTGKDTAVGAISHLTGETRHESSFEKGIGRFSAYILRIVVVTLIVMFVSHLVFRQGETHPFELLLFSIALAVSVIPEALPIVTTISLSKGALQLAKNHVVVKRLSAIEDLGSIEVLCTDKTGTITENRLHIAEIQAENTDIVIRYATLASACLGETHRDSNNSFDIALWQHCSDQDKIAWRKVIRKGEIPFDPSRRCNSALIQEGQTHTLIIRGAPEVIMHAAGLNPVDQEKAMQWITQQGKLGRRVLGIATKAMGDATTYTIAEEEHGFTFHGLVAFEDPIKPSTMQAVKDAQILGIHVKILTGDGADVAGAVAKQIGLISSAEAIITGAEFDALPPESRKQALETHHVFARVSPVQKHAIIQELKQHFEVGFLGEGINDAPALKAANVGIVVQAASDVAREAADIVLLEQSLEVVIRGIRVGREVFANTLKYIKGTLAANFGNFYAVAISTFFIPTLPMLPIQILLVNLLSDFPMMAIATDNVDVQELRRPRSYEPREIIKTATILGLVSTAFDFLFFGTFFRSPTTTLQTNWFMGSILTELVFMYSIRTQLPFWRASKPSHSITVLTIVAGVATLTLPYTHIGQRFFHFNPPSLDHLGLIVGITAAFFITTELVKIGYVKYTRSAK